MGQRVSTTATTNKRQRSGSFEQEEEETVPKQSRSEADETKDTAGLERENEVVEIFTNTYNGFYLYALPDVEETFRHRPLLLNNNPVLKRLVQNFIALQTAPPTYKALQYIEGPCSVRVVKGHDTHGNTKQFYIFGEVHGGLKKRNGQCRSKLMGSNTGVVTTIENYIKTLVSHTPKFLDIFVEVHKFSFDKTYFNRLEKQSRYTVSLLTSLVQQYNQTGDDMHALQQVINNQENKAVESAFSSTSSYKGSSILERLFREFYNCFEPSLRETDETCQLARFHFIDIRQSTNVKQSSVDKPGDSIYYLNLLYRLLLCFKPSHKNEYIKCKFRLKHVLALKPEGVSDFIFLHDFITALFKLFGVFDLLQYLVVTDCNFVALFEELELRSPMLLKELKVPHESIKHEILQFIHNQLSEKISKDDFKKTWRSFTSAHERQNVGELITLVLSLNKYMLEILAYAVDAYCLARVFRTFAHKPGKELLQPLVPSTYIIYAGNFHSQNYFYFLHHLENVGMFEVTEPVYVQENVLPTTEENKHDVDLRVTRCVYLPAEQQI